MVHRRTSNTLPVRANFCNMNDNEMIHVMMNDYERNGILITTFTLPTSQPDDLEKYNYINYNHHQ